MKANAFQRTLKGKNKLFMYRTVLFSFSFKIIQKLSVEWQGKKKKKDTSRLSFSVVYLCSVFGLVPSSLH